MLLSQFASPSPSLKGNATDSSVDLFFPEAVLKQDTLLLYNPKEYRGEKSLSFLPT